MWSTCCKALNATPASKGTSGKARARALVSLTPALVLADQERQGSGYATCWQGMVRGDTCAPPRIPHRSLLKCSRALGVTGVAVSTSISSPFRPSRQTSAATSWVISDTWSSSRTCSLMQFLARKRKRGGAADQLSRLPPAHLLFCCHPGCSPELL